MPTAPVVALSHGGGPLPILGDPSHKSIIYSLKHRIPRILNLGTPLQPQAIILVTAHWQTATPHVSSSAQHELLYDYSNFPPESYSLKYPAPGSPAIAQKVVDAFTAAGVKDPRLDPDRPWDHGVFVPLTLIHPQAQIPIVQVSVLQGEDVAEHMRMGEALRSLREQNIAVIGSGFASLHNLQTMRDLRQVSHEERAKFKAQSDEWNDALTNAVKAEKKDRRHHLEKWRKMPHADKMHPPNGGEHFMPLLVCAGAADDGEEMRSYKDEYLGMDILTYYWGGAHHGD
ncbi:hypothetical protein CDD81_5799 [Ophiocordyceps australis]|uniref:Extradiol ring-cleavage dioxygenase class III enzyme subunit B domain-containing protein n=1 Tax=Ophiocordyceps australis TaxID=1399860 RepID=A0A2C5XI62_9HYPO|nr:hypothetical protein CDD81_5799 [Ophiocordyceps australis]